jgi:hypothetical protein
MEKSKINRLFQVLNELETDIIEGLQKPLFHIRNADWETVLRGVQVDCEDIKQRLQEADGMVLNLMRKVTETFDTAKQMYKLRKGIEGQIAPATIGQAIGVLVGDFLMKGNDEILVDVVQERLVGSGIALNVKNPPAVIASILARDERLERVDKGKFKKKIPKDLEDQTVQKA